MFKRMQKLNERLEKEREKGLKVEDQGPPEMALDDDSDSDSSSSSSSSNDSSSEGETSDGGKLEGKAVKDESDGSSGSDSDDDDDTGAPEDDSPDDSPVASLEQAKADPIFIHPRAASKSGFVHRSCFLCPVANLKTERSISVHLRGNSHCRRLKRFLAYCDSKLTEEEKQDPSQGGLDVRTVVERIDKKLAVKAERQVKHKLEVRLVQREVKHKRILLKRERKQQEKKGKEEKKKTLLALRDVPDENGKKRQITADGETVRAKKKQKDKRVARLKSVLPPKAERKAAKKERKEIKKAAKRAAVALRAREGAAKNRAARERAASGV